MSAAELLTDLARLRIRLEARGGRLRYRPRSAVTPALIERMQAHKAELLRRAAGDAGPKQHAEPKQQAAPSATIGGPPNGPTIEIDPAELTPCPNCGTLEQWQSGAGNWRCVRCDPPTAAWRPTRPRRRRPFRRPCALRSADCGLAPLGTSRTNTQGNQAKGRYRP